ncbi:MAG TPA: hypothetical protein DDY20_03460 [Desulfobulbaceae bacterium]|nr:hypothetical protein [Desulfobulbaceae bacterium]
MQSRAGDRLGNFRPPELKAERPATPVIGKLLFLPYLEQFVHRFNRVFPDQGKDRARQSAYQPKGQKVSTG